MVHGSLRVKPTSILFIGPRASYSTTSPSRSPKNCASNSTSSDFARQCRSKTRTNSVSAPLPGTCIPDLRISRLTLAAHARRALLNGPSTKSNMDVFFLTLYLQRIVQVGFITGIHMLLLMLYLTGKSGGRSMREDGVSDRVGTSEFLVQLLLRCSSC